MVSEERKLNQ
jgi:hypothetical protein